MALLNIPTNTLSYDEAVEIYKMLVKAIDTKDEDQVESYNDIIKKCIRYAGIRAEWRLLSRQKKLDTDSNRTSAHDAVIRGLTILGRLQASNGVPWMEKLDMGNRKRIGDFACYVTLWSGLDAR